VGREHANTSRRRRDRALGVVRRRCVGGGSMVMVVLGFVLVDVLLFVGSLGGGWAGKRGQIAGERGACARFRQACPQRFRWKI